MRFAFAGDRDISVRVLKFILDQRERPQVLWIPEGASHGNELIGLLGDDVPVFEGREFVAGGDEMRAMDLDYVFCIHFPHLVPSEILEIPRVGILNLHPAYLPHNRGWHTPSWTILEESPAGATLHFMADSVDAGDIIHQKMLNVRPDDTAHTLYQRLKGLEYDLFVDAWPDVVRRSPPRRPQAPGAGTLHRKKDLSAVQPIDLDAPTTARALLRKLRALTTDRLEEAAYFEEGSSRYRVRVEIREEE